MNQQAFRVSKIAQRPPLSPPDQKDLKRSSHRLLAIQKKGKSPNDQTTCGSGSEDQQERSSSHNDSTSKSQQQEAINNLLKVLLTKGQKFKDLVAQKGETISNWIMESQSIVFND